MSWIIFESFNREGSLSFSTRTELANSVTGTMLNSDSPPLCISLEMVLHVKKWASSNTLLMVSFPSEKNMNLVCHWWPSLTLDPGIHDSQKMLTYWMDFKEATRNITGLEKNPSHQREVKRSEWLRLPCYKYFNKEQKYANRTFFHF